MDALLLDPDTGLDGQGLAEDRDSARLSQEVWTEIVSRSSHLGLDHPEEDIEADESPSDRPFAPCPTKMVGDTGLKGRVTQGLETTEANENRQGNDRRGVDGIKKTQSKESAPRAFSKEGFEGISTSDPAQGRQ